MTELQANEKAKILKTRYPNNHIYVVYHLTYASDNYTYSVVNMPINLKLLLGGIDDNN